MSSSRAQVLIVGAGPTGLTAALTLVTLGVSVRIIDKNNGRSAQSKALGIQAGTLECLEKIISPDLPRRLIEAGIQARTVRLHVDDREVVQVDLTQIPSVFDSLLILEQSETERILEEELASRGVRVERSVELVGLSQENARVTCTLRTSSAEVCEEFDFVIGCDGAHSTVRHLLGIPFRGEMYAGDFILGDVTLNWDNPSESIHAFVSGRGVCAAFPLKTERRYRLILMPKGEGKAPAGQNSSISLEEFRSIAADLSGGLLRVDEPIWLTRFRVHHRIVDRFQEDRCFLAGDAAHIHNPLGAQGMNIGMQDVINLSHKLKRVIAGQASVASLKDYEKERLPIARNVLRATHLALRAILTPENLAARIFRKSVLPAFLGSRWIQNRLITLISEVGTARREIARIQRPTSGRIL